MQFQIIPSFICFLFIGVFAGRNEQKGQHVHFDEKVRVEHREYAEPLTNKYTLNKRSSSPYTRPSWSHESKSSRTENQRPYQISKSSAARIEDQRSSSKNNGVSAEERLRNRVDGVWTSKRAAFFGTN
jgi:hypothetical protein